MDPLERRPEACLSDLKLDRLVAGEAVGDVEQHLAGCAACTARLTALRAAFARFPDEVFVAGAVQRIAGRRARRWAWPSTALVTAAVVLVAVWRAGGPDVRTKGGVSIGVTVKRSEQAPERVFSGVVVAPGDALRFHVASDRAGYVGVIGIDARGVACAYAPPAGAMLPLASGAEQLLPGAVLLDASLGKEEVVAVVCDASHGMDELVAGAVPDGCRRARFLIEKKPRAAR